MKRRYTINSKDVTKQEFFASLRGDCRKVVATGNVGGFGACIMDFDKKAYNHALRSLRAGRVLVFADTERVYASYSF